MRVGSCDLSTTRSAATAAMTAPRTHDRPLKTLAKRDAPPIANLVVATTTNAVDSNVSATGGTQQGQTISASRHRRGGVRRRQIRKGVEMNQGCLSSRS